MNPLRKTLVRPVAVAALAVGLAGCAWLSPAKTVTGTDTSPPPQESAPQTLGEDAAAADDDEEDVAGAHVAAELEMDLSGPEWLSDLPPREPYRDFTVRPPSPEPLFDYLPASSVLHNQAFSENEAFDQARTQRDYGGALATAQLALIGAAHLVNNGNAALFAPIVAATCAYCQGKLSAAYSVHDEGWVLDTPWALALDSGLEGAVDVQEISGPDHLTLWITGEEEVFVYSKENRTIVHGSAGAKIFNLEMLFDQGQWWVMGVASHEA